MARAGVFGIPGVRGMKSGVTSGGDPDFSNVSLLLHMDGADGSTTFIDNSNNGYTVTPSGNAQVDTAIVKYGTGALLLDGILDYLTIANAAPLQFGTGDFTVECWARIGGSTANFSGIVCKLSAGFGAGSWRIRWNAGPIVEAQVDAAVIQSGTISANTWYHLALTRSGTDLRFFVDGTQVGSTTTNSSDLNVTDALTIGLNAAVAMTGSIDDVRITKGVARYTANFTVPDAAFPDS